jgi:hypothetical protein
MLVFFIDPDTMTFFTKRRSRPTEYDMTTNEVEVNLDKEEENSY